MKAIFYFGILFLGCVACTAPKHTIATASPGINSEGKLFAALYQQRAAEYHALCLQAYNLAALRLEENLRSSTGKPFAIVTDIDETLLDNSPYAVHQALMGKDYEPDSWYAWTGKAVADTVPGAWTFLKAAGLKGIEIFYITNRDERERAATIQNLQHFHFPNADNEHLQLRQGESSKEVRRQRVAANHEIVLLLGDNLSDFSALFDKKLPADRLEAVKQVAGEFGKRFIVLPNPVYGDWESSLYHFNYGYTPQQKDSIIRASLTNY